jgi:hypothetical protein
MLLGVHKTNYLVVGGVGLMTFLLIKEYSTMVDGSIKEY